MRYGKYGLSTSMSIKRAAFLLRHIKARALGISVDFNEELQVFLFIDALLTGHINRHYFQILAFTPFKGVGTSCMSYISTSTPYFIYKKISLPCNFIHLLYST